MAYTALYRTWRPLAFDDVVGQSHITETLKNEIQRGRVGHAYLFCGSRGTGKTSTARILSRAMNCLSPRDGNPCNTCENCLGILDGTILDITEIDAASNNGVDSIRDLREEARFEGTALKNKIYIIDEVHMLTTSAFNALLKILEEPPEHVHFILATTEAHKVPATILSRCQRFDFHRIRTIDIEKQLLKILKADGFSAEERGVRLMAEKADGSMRDALSILDQCMAIGSNTLSYEEIAEFLGTTSNEVLYNLADGIAAQDKAKILSAFRAYANEGKQISRLSEDFIQYIRNLLLCKYTADAEKTLDMTKEVAEEMQTLSAKFSEEQLIYMLEIAVDTAAQMRHLTNPGICFELSLIKMSNPMYGDSREALLARVANLEGMLKGGKIVREEPKASAEPIKKKESVPKEKPSKINNSAITDAFNKNRDAILSYLISKNHLQTMMAIDSVDAVTERNGRLCLLFADESALLAAKTMLRDENMSLLKEAVLEKANLDVMIELDVSNHKEIANDPLSDITNF